MSTFTGRLLAATHLDMSELGRIMGETLTQVGIARPLLGVYEPSEDDPVAWSMISPGDRTAHVRFPTRTFPPAELSLTEPFRMIVIPLRLQDEFGFIAIESDDLASCSAIAFQRRRRSKALETSGCESRSRHRSRRRRNGFGRRKGWKRSGCSPVGSPTTSTTC